MFKGKSKKAKTEKFLEKVNDELKGQNKGGCIMTSGACSVCKHGIFIAGLSVRASDYYICELSINCSRFERKR